MKISKRSVFLYIINFSYNNCFW